MGGAEHTAGFIPTIGGTSKKIGAPEGAPGCEKGEEVCYLVTQV